MATKTHTRDGETVIVTIHDGAAKGEYKLHAPEMPTDGQLVIGHLSLSNPVRRQRLIVLVADMPGLGDDLKAARAQYLTRLDAEEANRVHHCERCGDKIEGEPVWRKGKTRGITVHDPLCATCAKLLRIAAGGIGATGESFAPADDDRTPYAKGDF